MPHPVLYLIPTYLSPSNDGDFLSPVVQEVIKNTTCYLVENARTARRFISSLGLGVQIDTLTMEVLDKKTSVEEVFNLLNKLKEVGNIGVMSEAGLPGLADPGGRAIALAHQLRWEVRPLPGASSIQTAICASGFSGQAFTFHGYLPIAKLERIKKLKTIYAQFHQTGYTQVFMETPYRNLPLLKDIIAALNSDTLLHITCDAFGSSQLVKTQKLSEWKKSLPDIHKLPAVFCIGQYQ